MHLIQFIMSKIKNLVAGLAGSIMLNLLHESLRKQRSDVPRIDLLGKDALQKTLHYLGTGISNKDDLYKATLTGDIVSNTMYYSLIGAGNPRYIWRRAIVMGFTAGLGAIELPKPMGLNPASVASTDQKKMLTIGYYLFGAIVTAAALTLLKKR